jgi:hypothetical protein
MSHDIAFLHTAEVHIPTFQKLVEDIDSTIRVRHEINAALLSDAVANGITVQLSVKVEKAMRDAASSSAGVVVCTCSTIGGIAEKTSLHSSALSMRIDRAMADLAINSCNRILIVAAVESTLEPTKGLLEESSKNIDKYPHLSLELIDGAWRQFEAGDMKKYYNCLEEYINQNKDGYDGVVLAQASMAPVASRFFNSGTRVFASPELGVKFALAQIRTMKI